jgi:hypothetical protein
LGEQPVELGAAAAGPGHSSVHGALLDGRRVVDVGAVVQTHHDIGAEAQLQPGYIFPGQLKFAVAAFGPDDQAVVGERACFGLLADQRVGLKAPGIGQDSASPAAQGVQAAQAWTVEAPGCCIR